MDSLPEPQGLATSDLWLLMERVEGSIDGITGKASILFYLNGFLLTNLAIQWPSFARMLRHSDGSWDWLGAVAVVALTLTAVGVSLSLWASYTAILPGNVSSRKRKRKPSRSASQPLSLIFFAHICSRSLDEYRKEVNACSQEELRDDLIRQIHSLANLVHRKQQSMRRAVQADMVLAIPSVIALIAVYLRLSV